MFGFNSNPASVDWSFYGGAERTGPSIGKHSNSTTSATTSRSHSPSDASDSYNDSDSLDDSTVDELLSSSDSSHQSSSPSCAVDPDSQSVPQPIGLKWAPRYPPTPTTSQDDFLWLLTEEPHRTRRAAILSAHPEVRSLMGREPKTKYISFLVTLTQVLISIYMGLNAIHPLSWKFLLTAYVIGGTANQNTFLAIHEITHNLAFKGIKMNKAWACLVNLCIGVPYAMSFKPYHIEHHKHLGEDGVDTDLPTRFEMMCLKNVLGKAFFATFQIFFYALRPGIIRAQTPTFWHFFNLTLQLTFNYFLVKYTGWYSFFYLLESSFFAGSLHPMAAHFIAEHYLFGGIEQETWSYYGGLNWLAYNVGYHNEHHDFPSIPWTRLPKLRQMAPEFYDCLPCHKSWPLVTLQFILGEDSGLFARIKRKGKGETSLDKSDSREKVEVGLKEE